MAGMAGMAELARLDGSRRHPAGEPATRHGTAGRSGKDHDTTEPRAGSPVGEGGGHVPSVSEGRCLEPASHR
jgi:hypothetical protein